MIIGLVGFKQVGKSTAAKHLEKYWRAARVNMKDQLIAEMKENLMPTLKELCDIYGYWEELTIEDQCPVREYDIPRLFEEKPRAMRALMQNYGTEVRRGDDENYWCERWLEKARSTPWEQHPVIVVDDVRFKNEADYVRKFKSKIIRLTRPDVASGGTHASETEQLEIQADYTIECEPGDHERLYLELDKIMEEIAVK